MMKNKKIILFWMFFSIFWSIFFSFDDFLIIQFLRKINKQKFLLRKTFFSYLMNWDLGHIQSSVDDIKIAIRKISIRSIRKLFYFDQQTIVGGPHFNLTNGEISIMFSFFVFVKFIFQIISSFCFNFDWFSNYFNQTYVFFHFLLVQINNGSTLSFIAIWRV